MDLLEPFMIIIGNKEVVGRYSKIEISRKCLHLKTMYNSNLINGSYSDTEVILSTLLYYELNISSNVIRCKLDSFKFNKESSKPLFEII